jgi:hypothetical protein
MTLVIILTAIVFFALHISLTLAGVAITFRINKIEESKELAKPARQD